MSRGTPWRENLSLARRELRARRGVSGALQRRIRGSLAGPPPPPRPRRRGTVWVVALVRDEIDVIDGFVDHHLGQGAEHLLIADNGSRDGTFETLTARAHQDPRVTVLRDGLREFHQGAKTTHLSRLAWRAGADWVVPADADERWMGEEDTLRGALRRAARRGLDVVTVDIHNAYPTSAQPGADWAWDPSPHPTVKVAYRSHPLLEVGDGCHWVRRPGRTGRGLHFLHLPWRSRHQLEEKVRKGAAGLSAAGLEDPASGVDGHWEQMRHLSSTQLDAVWAEICGGPDSGIDFGYKPHRERLALPGLSPRTWHEVLAAAGAEDRHGR